MSDSDEFESADEETSKIYSKSIIDEKTSKSEEKSSSFNQPKNDVNKAEKIDVIEDVSMIDTNSIISNEIKNLEIKNKIDFAEVNKVNHKPSCNHVTLKQNINNVGTDDIKNNPANIDQQELSENETCKYIENKPNTLTDTNETDQRLLLKNVANIPKVTSSITNNNDSSLIKDNSKTQAPTFLNFWGSSSNSLSFIKTNVVKNINSMIESVEQKLAIPSPESLANTPIIKNLESNEVPTNTGYFVKSIADVGKKFMSEGYEKLEMLGKKTIEVLDNTDLVDKEFQDKKIKLFDNDNKISLSDLLKEAQTQNEPSTENNRNSLNEDLIISIQELIDEDQGCVQVQALEMLSKRCNEKIIKMENIINEKGAIVPGSIEELQKLFKIGLDGCENQPFEKANLSDINFVEDLTNTVIKLNLKATSTKIIQAYDPLVQILEKDYSIETNLEILKSLSKFVCATTECLHKIGQSLLIDKKTSRTSKKLIDNTEENAKLIFQKASSVIDLTKLVVEVIYTLPTQILPKILDAQVDDGIKRQPATLKKRWEGEVNYCVDLLTSATRLLLPICQLKELECFLANL